MSKFTTEQQNALDEFEKAVSSYDLTAYGHGRKFRACEWLVKCAAVLKELGVDDALTPNEKVHVERAQAFIT